MNSTPNNGHVKVKSAMFSLRDQKGTREETPARAVKIRKFFDEMRHERVSIDLVRKNYPDLYQKKLCKYLLWSLAQSFGQPATLNQSVCLYPQPRKTITGSSPLGSHSRAENEFFGGSLANDDVTRNLADRLLRHRLLDPEVSPEEPIIDFSKISARRIIAAEKAVLSTILSSGYASPNASTGYFDDGIWPFVNQIECFTISGNFDASYRQFSYKETVSLGEGSTYSYMQCSQPHSNHIGEFYTNDIGLWKQIWQRICRITSCIPHREAELISLMKGFCKYRFAVTERDLQHITGTFTTSGSLETLGHVTFLNRLFYHTLVKAPASWILMASDNFSPPLLAVHAASLQLLFEGNIRLEQIFGPLASFGVYQGLRSGVDLAKQGCRSALLRKLIAIIDFHGTCVLNRRNRDSTEEINYFEHALTSLHSVYPL